MFKKSVASAFLLLFVLSAWPLLAADDPAQGRDASAPIVRFLKAVRQKGIVKAFSDMLTVPKP